MKGGVLLALMLVGVFLAGCGTKTDTTAYATYNQPQQQQYVGGGCGVAPGADYSDAPINSLPSSGASL